LGDLSDTHQYNAGEQLSLTLTQETFEIGAKGSFRYSNALNNLNPVKQITKSWTATGNILFRLPYSINIGSDLNYSTLQGFSITDQKYLIWNATIDKTIFKNKKGVIAFKINDILHQQLNYQQTVGDNSITYSKFNTLPSYFIVSFAYKIADFGGAKNRDGRDFQRFGPGGPGGPGGDHPHMPGGGNDGPPRF
jgi:hypothetical protein